MTFLLFIIPIILFLLFFFIERRTIWIGFSFIILVGYLTAFTAIYLESMQQSLLYVLLLILSILLLLFPLYIISFILALISSGIRLVKKEGRKFHNLLSLALGIFIIVWSIIANLVQIPSDRPLLGSIAFFLTYAVGYFFLVMASFAIAALFNRYRHPWKNYHYIIVLGSGLIGDQVPPLLASRIDKGIALWKKAKVANIHAKVVFTGGKGSDELIAEGVAMADYALKNGLKREDIIIEDQAVNTYENVLFSRRLIEADWEKQQMDKHPNIVTVTNNFHVFRALLWARKVGLKSDGAGARTKFYFWLNALIREYIAVLFMQRTAHIFMIMLGFLIALGTFIINHYFVIPYDIGQ